MLPFRDGGALRALFFGVIGASFLIAPADFAQQSKKHSKRKDANTEAPAQPATPTPGSGTQVPCLLGMKQKDSSSPILMKMDICAVGSWLAPHDASIRTTCNFAS